MRSYLLLFCLLGLSVGSFAQQTINATMMHDGTEREYILYVPDSYTGDDPVPLILNFHGYTSNALEQMNYGDFRPIADTAGFLVVHPEGLLFNGNTHWNVGGWTVGSTVDDVGFTAALLEELASQYNIDSDRVYSTGMSNGGFMSFLLACQLSDKIAAVASVTGSMTPETYNACDPEHPTPVLQMHGTADGVVPYIGAFWTRSINDVLAYWVDFNNCYGTETVTPIPNTVVLDGSTVEHIVYDQGDYETTVEHFKVAAGGHTWPGTFFSGPGTNQDIDASLEIWKFFSRYNLSDLNPTTDVDEQTVRMAQTRIFPNPAGSMLNVELTVEKPVPFEIISVIGTRMKTGLLEPGVNTIDVSDLSADVYFLKVGESAFKVVKIH